MRIDRRSFGQITLAALAAITLSGAACSKKSDDIPVGAYLSLTGSDSAFGQDTKKGIELAVEQVNTAGGVGGKKVRLIVEDDKSMPNEATQKVQQLIDREGVVALIGEVASSRSMAGGLIANNKKVPMITPSSTAVEVTQGREYVFRTCFTDDQQGEVAARFVFEKLGKKNVGILYAAQDTYSSGLAQSFKDSFEKLGGKIVVKKGFQKGETNYTTYLNELKAAKPELIFAPVYFNEIGPIARQAKDVGIAGSTFFGGDGWSGLSESEAVELEGAYLTDHFAPDVPWPNSQAFIAAFKAKYKDTPNSLAAQGYDSAQMLFDAMKRATEIKPEAIKNALKQTKDFKGATGTLTIDANRNATKPVVIAQVKAKRFSYQAELLAK